MGTRACFYLGDPREKDFKWLGCVAGDGYRFYSNPTYKLEEITTKEGFIELVEYVKKECAEQEGAHDFADPEKGGFPFPWVSNLFLTDLTYAFFDNKVFVSWFDTGFKTVIDQRQDHGASNTTDPKMKNVRVGVHRDLNQPDSIIILRKR